MNRRHFAICALAAALSFAGACTTTAPTNQNAAATTPTPAQAAGLPAELKPVLDSINTDDLMRHITALSSDEYEGRGPGTKGEELTVKYLTEQFQRLGLKPGNPDGTYVQKVPLVGFTRRAGGVVQGRRQGDRAHEPDGLRRRLAPLRAAGQRRRLRHRLRRLRRGRARVRLGRLQGRRRQGQDHRHAHQRPGRARPGRPHEARREDVQGQGHDLLRPLDVQVRDRDARRARPPPSSSTRPARRATPSRSSRGAGGARTSTSSRPTRTWGASASSRGSPGDRRRSCSPPRGRTSTR